MQRIRQIYSVHFIKIINFDVRYGNLSTSNTRYNLHNRNDKKKNKFFLKLQFNYRNSVITLKATETSLILAANACK